MPRAASEPETESRPPPTLAKTAPSVAGFGTAGIVSAGEDKLHARGRLAGFRDRLRATLPSCPCAVATTSADQRRLADFLRRLPKPCGILAYNDVAAREALDLCRTLAIDVPDSLAILGCDNESDICENCSPPLSSIEIDFEQSGLLAAKTALALAEGARPAKAAYGPRILVERDSTTSLLNGARIVSAAASTLRALGGQADIRSLAHDQHLSLRTLELRFRAVLKSTPKAFAQRLRLDNAKDLLAKTHMPIKEVATRCGFSSTENFHHFFRKHTKTTPAAYRRTLFAQSP